MHLPFNKQDQGLRVHLLPRSLVPSTAPETMSENQVQPDVPREDEQSWPSSINADDEGKHIGTSSVSSKRRALPGGFSPPTSAASSALRASNNSSPGRRTTNGPLIVPVSPLTPAVPDITVISFTNLGMLDFALNWAVAPPPCPRGDAACFQPAPLCRGGRHKGPAPGERACSGELSQVRFAFALLPCRYTAVLMTEECSLCTH